MKPSAISVNDVIRFANEHAGEPLTTLAQNKHFTIRPGKTGIRYELPNGSNWPINPDLIQEYLDVYNKRAPEERTKTASYPLKWRERSYMVSILFQITSKCRNAKRGKADGLNDLDVPVGNDTPDRASSVSFTVIRDPEVRYYVIKKAEGRCEYCKKEGFLMQNGLRYLEAHHIISLAHQGKDTVKNVIALCPEHHREAHYGAEAEALEKDFLRCIRERK